MFKIILTVLIVLISRVTFSQTDFEFGGDLEEVPYYEYLEDNAAYINLSEDKFFQKRKELKISQINVRHLNRSLDSLYSIDTSNFHSMIVSGVYDHGYSYIERFCFDENGLILSRNKYPISQHISRSDSGMLNSMQLKIIAHKNLDSSIISKNWKGEPIVKFVHLNNLIYSINREPIIETKCDPSNKSCTTTAVGYKHFTTRFFFTNDNKISRIKCEGDRTNFDLTFQRPDSKTIVVSGNIRTQLFPDIKNLENKIIKNSKGKLMESTFRYTHDKEKFSKYILSYDKHGYLKKLSYYIKYVGWFDDKKEIFKLKNFYKNGKLTKSVKHFDSEDKILDRVYFYNDKGLVSEEHVRGYRCVYEYSFYE